MPDQSAAFAPGRVNLIGEHTDYNDGLALPFAIREGVIVRARRTGSSRIEAHALDLGDSDSFALGEPIEPSGGWRAYVRGVTAEWQRAGIEIPGARLQIAGTVPRGCGLSSSAALEVALSLALLALAGAPPVERLALARICSRAENDWVGAHTGLLDQLASLHGAVDTALRIDFRSMEIEPVAVALEGWRLMTLDSGERHSLGASGYNERRRECARACETLHISSLRQATPELVAGLPRPLRQRAEHVLSENERVRETVRALTRGDLSAVGDLLDASHASLRCRYEVSTPAVDAAAESLRRCGAAGARLIGGGFGGHVLGLFPPGTKPPEAAHEVRAGAGAHLVP